MQAELAEKTNLKMMPQSQPLKEVNPQMQKNKTILSINNFDFYYGSKQVLFDINIDIAEKKVTALIGPSGCGKSTMLHNLNRMTDLIEGTRQNGSISFHGENIKDPSLPVISLRRRIGMVFQRSNPFPKSIYENVIFSLRVAGIKDKPFLDRRVEECLKAVALWDEVHDRLHDNALGLSGGQMQRLCIARAIASEPEILLMDEPCSALDPIATARIEALIHELKNRFTIVIVTHNMQQAARISDYTAFLYMGKLVEFGATGQIFTNPKNQQTEEYITGRFG